MTILVTVDVDDQPQQAAVFATMDEAQRAVVQLMNTSELLRGGEEPVTTFEEAQERLHEAATIRFTQMLSGGEFATVGEL